jgi:hypothetical protein
MDVAAGFGWEQALLVDVMLDVDYNDNEFYTRG